MKFQTWPLEVRLVALAWVPGVLAAVTATFLLQYGMIERRDEAYGLSMLAGLGLTALLIYEFLSWIAWGTGFFEACFRLGMFDEELMAKGKQRRRDIINVLIRRLKRP